MNTFAPAFASTAFGGEVSLYGRTASGSTFAVTTASPASLGTIMRGYTLVRPLDRPLSFRCDIHNFEDVGEA